MAPRNDAQLSASTSADTPARKKFPFLTGLILGAVVAMSANEVRKGGAYLTKLTDAVSPIHEAMLALDGKRAFLKGSASGTQGGEQPGDERQEEEGVHAQPRDEKPDQEDRQEEEEKPVEDENRAKESQEETEPEKPAEEEKQEEEKAVEGEKPAEEEKHEDEKPQEEEKRETKKAEEEEKQKEEEKPAEEEKQEDKKPEEEEGKQNEEEKQGDKKPHEEEKPAEEEKQKDKKPQVEEEKLAKEEKPAEKEKQEDKKPEEEEEKHAEEEKQGDKKPDEEEKPAEEKKQKEDKPQEEEEKLAKEEKPVEEEKQEDKEPVEEEEKHAEEEKQGDKKPDEEEKPEEEEKQEDKKPEEEEEKSAEEEKPAEEEKQEDKKPQVEEEKSAEEEKPAEEEKKEDKKPEEEEGKQNEEEKPAEDAKVADEEKPEGDETPEQKVPTKDEDHEPIKLDKNTIAKGSSYEHKREPLNILLLYADDMRHDSIGAAGTQIVRTPFIDQLARDGIRFTHNCVTTAVCWISRATLYTGQFMSRHGTTYPEETPWYKNWRHTFPARLKKAGYYLGQVGKWHFDDSKLSEWFDVQENYYGDHWYGDVHTTKKSEKDGIEFLKNRPKDKPFMLSVCFFAPHSVDHDERQYLPQPESMHLYENETVVEPVSNTLEAWKALPSDFGEDNEARRRWRMRFNETEKYQTMMKNYFRLISEVSESSGKIVEELERQGILNNTMIIFTTDNGYFHAEHGMAGKWYPHQESIRVPLVIRDPRMPKDKIGTLNDEFTLNIDLATTILGAAGLPQAPTMQGRDIADLYLAEGEEWRDEFFFEHPVHLSPDVIPESSALVRKDFKYMRWPGSKTEQLFDLKADPLELNDLIKSEEHQDLIAEMRKRHNELQMHAK